MKVFDNSWRTFAVRGLVLCAAVFGTVRLAMARPGVAGGSAGSFVTVAGTLTGVSGATMATFEFRRAGSTIVLCAPQVTITPGSGGAFSVPVPLDQPELSATTRCPDDLFDGQDVQVRVVIGGNEAATWAPINPVPYAHFASVAGTANVATQYGTPDCPVGYERLTDAMFTGDTRLCVRRRSDGMIYDEVVRVGTGASAFWIDRFEASTWPNPDGTFMDGRTTPYGVSDDYPTQFPDNGQWTTARPPVFAVSRRGVTPTQHTTWFQAVEACAASGKRLPTNSEWQRAARGTPDPNDPMTSPCNVNSGPIAVTSPTTGCRSAWLVADMVGNVRELTDDWYVGVGDTDRPNAEVNRNWPVDYGTDLATNIAARVSPAYATPGLTLPAVALRGGGHQDRQNAGVFALMVHTAPTFSFPSIGFRCVIPR